MLIPGKAGTMPVVVDRRRVRVAAFAVIACEVTFITLFVVALRNYPGGTWFDRQEPTSFWKNFLCDFEWEVALDGLPNPIGSSAMKIGMIALACAFAPLWLMLPDLFVRGSGPSPGSALGRVVRILGVLSAIGILAVPLTPSDRFGAWHSLAVVVAGVAGLSAAVLGVIGLFRHEETPRLAATIGAAMLGTAAFDLALYVRLVLGKGEVPLMLPVIQKVSLMLVLMFMTVVSLAVLRRARGT